MHSQSFSARFKTLLILSSLGFTFSALTDGQLFGQADSALTKKSSAADGVIKTTQSSTQGKTKFLKLAKDKSGSPTALQTALTRYKSEKGGVIVDLIGAVHIGEGDYYQQLNRQFELYDVVLYELVAPQGTRVPAGGKRTSNNPISMIQGSMQSMLGLQSQLEKVDYQKKNFVHADMSPSEMSAKMKERGDTVLTVGLSAFTEILRQQNKAASDSESGAAIDNLANQLNGESLFDLMGNPLKMKQMMAMQFAQDGAMDLGLGQTLNRMLIDDRNAAAMKVLQRQLVEGKKKIGIFYGAAHMPDFEKRLAELGMKKTDQVWVDAWDLTKAGGKQKSPTSMLMNLLDQLSK